ncbi:NADPH:quinone reductase [Dictyobacter alpinus]|uniref:NADPH:quinone reductase n=1 Tax=Dictyobacter alpinus TaxID=2014873 RepID=A0A402BF69_9CHLR|nr:NADP-dependent oxidoreductase [Dictyobacter alpinus]GCE29930.1 NADPH:quinone reductase [Dictyobacter alpinus]
MKAIRIHGRGGADHLVYEDAPKPEPGPGEVLVRVHAAGVIATELTWDETYRTGAGIQRTYPIPGHDFSGVVEEAGADVTNLAKGAEVYALIDFDRDGAAAEYAIVRQEELALKPRSLDHVQAAAVPLTALTAWQALFEHAGLQKGQTILIHGAAGGVGVFAVQFARWAGARVIATGSAANHDLLRELGASEVIDYTTTRFEEVVKDVDVVLDSIGGETIHRSLQIIKPGGTLVSITSPRPSFDEAKAFHVRPIWFIVRPNHDQLTRIASVIDEGHIRPIIDTVLPLSQARQAYEYGAKGHTRGKIVLSVVE